MCGEIVPCLLLSLQLTGFRVMATLTHVLSPRLTQDCFHTSTTTSSFSAHPVEAASTGHVRWVPSLTTLFRPASSLPDKSVASNWIQKLYLQIINVSSSHFMRFCFLITFTLNMLSRFISHNLSRVNELFKHVVSRVFTTFWSRM